MIENARLRHEYPLRDLYATVTGGIEEHWATPYGLRVPADAHPFRVPRTWDEIGTYVARTAQDRRTGARYLATAYGRSATGLLDTLTGVTAAGHAEPHRRKDPGEVLTLMLDATAHCVAASHRARIALLALVDDQEPTTPCGRGARLIAAWYHDFVELRRHSGGIGVDRHSLPVQSAAAFRASRQRHDHGDWTCLEDFLATVWLILTPTDLAELLH